MPQAQTNPDKLHTEPPCPADLLRCPLTGERLQWSPPESWDALRAAIGRRRLIQQDGTPADPDFTGAYATTDEKRIYLVRDGIIRLLPQQALSTPGQFRPLPMRPEKAAVQRYYDETGWKLNQRGGFADTARYEDSRHIVADYVRTGERRIRNRLPNGGRYLLDVGSGPLARPEHYAIGNQFERRICLDLSFAALRAARNNLGRRGIYLQGDAARLPIADRSVDAAIALHTLGQVPADEQRAAVCEIARTLQPPATAVVSLLGDSSVTRALHGPVQLLGSIFGAVRNAVGSQRVDGANPRADSIVRSANETPTAPSEIPRGVKWVVEQQWPFEFDLTCWKSIPMNVMRTCIHRRFAGGSLLQWLKTWEDADPQRAARWASLPMLVIRVKQAEELSATEPFHKSRAA